MQSGVAIVVHGAAGQMGQALLRVIGQRNDLRIVGALVRPDSAFIGEPLTRRVLIPDACDIVYTASLDPNVDFKVLIDFSSPAAFDAALAFALQRKVAFVSGTTGLNPQQYQALERAATEIPVLWSANFSLGIALLTRFAREAALQLKQWDCEIIEAHHKHKKDAPSGTALALGRVIAEARSQDFAEVGALARPDHAVPRRTSNIGFSAIRAGDIVGDHTVLFAGEGERLELTHRATNRDIFAQGAITAACWLATQQAGCYDLIDVLDQIVT